jgi:hypothetical protein
MLRQLQIKISKGWKDAVTINMAPITLFFGEQHFQQIQYRIAAAYVKQATSRKIPNFLMWYN